MDNFSDASVSLPIRVRGISDAAISSADLTQECREMLGGFAWQRIEAAGLVDIACTIRSEAELGEEELGRLAVQPLAFLGKLLSLRGARTAESAPVALLRPLVFLPLAEKLESGGVGAAVAALRGLMEEDQIARFVREQGPVLCAFDRWHGKFSTGDFFAALRELFLPPSISSFRVLGPSAKDIKDMILGAGKNVDSDEDVEGFFARELAPGLRSIGVDTVQGGTSLRIHSAAGRHGLQNYVAHDLNRHRLAENSFIRHLLAIRQEVSHRSTLTGWLPLFRSILDQGSPGAAHPLGLEVLKSVALARLAFPEARLVQAPLSIFGLKAADVALHFGANDLGFAAVDAETARRLDLPLLSILQESFSTAPVRVVYSEDNL